MATKAPTGLAITRSGNVFTCTWKRGQSYNKKQQFASWLGEWSAAVDIGKADTTRTVTVDFANFYPRTATKLPSFQFQVRGLHGKSWSAFTQKSFALSLPNPPSIEGNKDENLATTVKFTWSVVVDEDNTSSQIFTDVEYQSILLAGSNITDGTKLEAYFNSNQMGWMTGTGAAADSRTVTESSENVSSGSHTRWFRVRSRGPAGASAWRYARFVYAAPHAANITSATATKVATGGYQVTVKWDAVSSPAYPIDKISVEYMKAVPAAGMAVPSGSSWTVARTLLPTGTSGAASFPVDGDLDNDQVLFVRVNTEHESQSEATHSVAKIAAYGKLDAPAITDITTNDATFRATVTVTKNSEVPDVFTVIVYRTAERPSVISTVGVISSGTSYTAQLPDWTGQTKQFGVYNAVGTYSQITRSDGTSSFAVNVTMTSDTEWDGGSVPNAPTNVNVASTSTPGTVRITWDWPWQDANSATISWADHADAWQSTDEPDDYTIENTHANEWFVSGLETGQRWYFRVRLTQGTGDNAVNGAWSEIVSIDLSSAPVLPTLSLSSGVITEGGSVSAFWSYVSTDGTYQAYAEVCEATISGSGITYGDIIASTQTAQHVTIYADEVGWNVGETHYLCVRVVSASGRASDGWSDPVPVIIAAPLEINIASTSLSNKKLTAMPLTATITGAGNGGITQLIIERAESYHIDRPNEEDFNGYQGETIAIFEQTGEAQITINREDLFGSLDDGASYNLIATIQDGLGQSASETIRFEVDWAHQALMPEATVRIEDGVAVITPTAPSGAAEGDTVDIYRLSADKPELIVKGAEFGTEYVDPYPAFNEYGGHRIVYRTIDGDYITAEGDLAWIDLQQDAGDYIKSIASVVDFDGTSIELFYDTTHSTSWEKGFRETEYLGGSIQGDWGKAVKTSSSVKTAKVTVEDQASMQDLRRLAAYPGICHIRTVDGSSYACDIEISVDRQYDQETVRATYNLDITKVDTDSLDGMTYAEWEMGE